MKTVIGLFDTSSDAFAAQNELLAAGVARDRISVITSQLNKDYHITTFPVDRSEAGEGAGIGAVAGAIAGGALASLGLFAIPGIGPFLGTGVLVSTLLGAGAGAVAGGLIGALIGLGIPENEAEVYEEGVKRGGVLLSVDALDADAHRVAMIMSQHNAVDIDRRATEWQTSGWQRRYPPLPPHAPKEPPTMAAPTSPTVNTLGVIDPRARGVDRPGEERQTESRRTDSGALRKSSSARIYNP